MRDSVSPVHMWSKRHGPDPAATSEAGTVKTLHPGTNGALSTSSLVPAVLSAGHQRRFVVGRLAGVWVTIAVSHVEFDTFHTTCSIFAMSIMETKITITDQVRYRCHNYSPSFEFFTESNSSCFAVPACSDACQVQRQGHDVRLLRGCRRERRGDHGGGHQRVGAAAHGKCRRLV